VEKEVVGAERGAHQRGSQLPRGGRLLRGERGVRVYIYIYLYIYMYAFVYIPPRREAAQGEEK